MPGAGGDGILGSVSLIQLLYRMKRGLLRIGRIRTRGVKVLVVHADGHVLLVRNSYGNTGHFVLPGGGIRPFEAPLAAALREVREEVGLDLSAVHLLSVHASTAEGKRDSIHLFHGEAEGTPSNDSREIEEAAFFALDALPDGVSPATQRRIEEWQGRREADGSW